MNLKSMKMTDEEKGDYCQPSACMSAPEFPYGLKICLDKSSLEKLGISTLPELGATLKLEARVEVCMTRECKDGDGVDRGLDLQITDMSIAAGDPKSDPASSLYGKAGV